MNQRQINKMHWHERQALLEGVAADLNGKLNLFGIDQEPISLLLKPGLQEWEVESILEDILTPDNMDFPKNFCERARPTANLFLRTFRQIKRAEAEKQEGAQFQRTRRIGSLLG